MDNHRLIPALPQDQRRCPCRCRQAGSLAERFLTEPGRNPYRIFMTPETS